MRKIVVSIGIDAYADTSIPRLRYAGFDARGFADELVRMGADRGDVHLLTDESATRTRILATIETVAASCGTADIVCFFFAGHGAPDFQRGASDDARQFIVPHDAALKSLDASCIRIRDLVKALDAINSERVVVFLDSCFSGVAGGRTLEMPGTRAGPMPVGRAYLEALSGKGRTVIAACKGNELARENDSFQHGCFSYFLLTGLEGKADRLNDGHVDLDMLWRYIQEQMADTSQTPVRTGTSVGLPIVLGPVRNQSITPEVESKLALAILANFPRKKLKRILLADSDDEVSLGKRAALYLDSALSHRTRVAVSCGRSLIETIMHMSRSGLEGVRIIPLNGSPSDEVRLSDSMVLSYLLWSKFEPDNATVRAVPTGIPDKLFATVAPGVREIAADVLREAMRAERFLFGIGSLTGGNRNISKLLQKAGLSPEAVRNIGAVGELNFRLFDSMGTFLEDSPSLTEDEKRRVRSYGSRFFALSAADLRKLARSNRADLIAVAGGVHKQEAIAAAIEGNLVRTLITDLKTAQWLSECDRRAVRLASRGISSRAQRVK